MHEFSVDNQASHSPISFMDGMAAAGWYITQAAEEAAFEQGGEVFAGDMVNATVSPVGLLPDPRPLLRFGVQEILERAVQINDEELAKNPANQRMDDLHRSVERTIEALRFLAKGAVESPDPTTR